MPRLGCSRPESWAQVTSRQVVCLDRLDLFRAAAGHQQDDWAVNFEGEEAWQGGGTDIADEGMLLTRERGGGIHDRKVGAGVVGDDDPGTAADQYLIERRRADGHPCDQGMSGIGSQLRGGESEQVVTLLG